MEHVLNRTPTASFHVLNRPIQSKTFKALNDIIMSKSCYECVMSILKDNQP